MTGKEQTGEDIAFPELGYNDRELNEVWRWIRDDLAAEGKVYNHKIKDQDTECPADYPADTLVKDVLPKLRNALEERDIIEIDYEEGGGDEKGGALRKLWVIHK